MTEQLIPDQPPVIQIPQQCQPQPIPTAWVVQPHPSGHVVVTLFDATGQRVLILAADDAARFAADITAQISTARSGLIVPGGSL